MALYKLIMIDECGQETEVASFNLSLLTDEDEIAIWQSTKVTQYMEQYPEALGFYWEDRSQWSSAINCMLHDPTLDFDEAIEKGFKENAPCDTYGYCPYGDEDCDCHCNC